MTRQIRPKPLKAQPMMALRGPVITGQPRHGPAWTKKRTFVRALEGTYGEMMDHVYDQPRVYSSKDHAWHGGPQSYGKEIINPADAPVAQSIETPPKGLWSLWHQCQSWSSQQRGFLRHARTRLRHP